MTAPLADRPAPTDGTGLRVLVVDDERAVREGLRRLIAGGVPQAAVVRIAGSPAEALREAQALEPHVVVLDLDLAGEDGLALMHAFGAACHVLILSSHGDSTTRALARSLGASAFIEKHEPASVLLAHLSALAARR